ncbi:MAG TPA: hypothetical protein VMT73_06670 [Anaerolineales bacterium]|nr:hypothetical protein [Anaerolineales bacterium]
MSLPINPNLVTGVLSFLFTVFVFSYLLGDNPLFRIATYIFVGVVGGYVASVAMWQVIYPKLVYPLVYGSAMERGMAAIPLLLSGLILMKFWPRFSGMGGPAMAYLVGVSAAVTVGGAVIGTLFPQVFATINTFDVRSSTSPIEALFDAVLILVGVSTTLIYFHFGARTTPDGSVQRLGLIEIFAWIGRIFIAITLGVLFAGVFLASLTALIERFASFSSFFASFH